MIFLERLEENSEENTTIKKETMQLIRSIKIFVVTIVFTSQLLSTGWIDDTIGFMRGGMRNFAAVGTVFPLSRYMAAAMIDKIAQTDIVRTSGQIKIVEMGAGNGALTEYFVAWIDQQMHDTGKEYQLDLVELDQDFCEILKQKFKAYPWISVYCCDAGTYKNEQPYDIVVSTLPFNSHFFVSDDVENILTNFESLLKKRGIFMYVEYAACGSINKNFVLSKEQQQIYLDKQAILAGFKKKHKAKSTIIFRNIPPTYLYSMHIAK